MTECHLHLHLEPEQRKRRSIRSENTETWSRESFFESHQLDSPNRTVVTAWDLHEFISGLAVEQRAQEVEYVELRLSPRRFIADGLTWDQFLTISHRTMTEIQGVAIRGILLVNRDSPSNFIDDACEKVAECLPKSFVGVDIAGDDQIRSDLPRLTDYCEIARRAGLGVTIHAGEFGDMEAIWSALDDFGASRISHALGAANSPALMARMAAEEILVELSLSSNRALGAWREHERHPAADFLDKGISVCFNSDVPLHTRADLGKEYELAQRCLGLTSSDIHAIQTAAKGRIFDSGVVS
jgi:adenosine deaminase